MKHPIFIVCCWLFVSHSFGKEFKIISPDNKTEVTISQGSEIEMYVRYQGGELFKLKNISLNIRNQDYNAAIKKIRNTNSHAVSKLIFPVIKEKYKEILDEYSELIIDFRSDYSLSVRVYNNGVAYRFHTSFSEPVIVNSENVNIQFENKDSIYFQRSKTFNSSYETPYEHQAVKDLSTEGYYCLPALVIKNGGTKVLISESDLVDYPGLWLAGNGQNSLKSAHAGYPLSFKYEGNAYGQGQVKEHADYIAKVDGTRSYPWRIFAIADKEAELLRNTLVYQLASPSLIEDASWITPGVVTFDWWGRRGIYGTDFKSGINTETAKYFIDFASEFGFEYFLFDDGWSKQGDLFAINEGLDMEAVMDYANEKDVKIMLWAIWNTFEKQKDKAWTQFEKWGISGLKFDFMNRDDQKMVQFYHEVAHEAATRKMVLDFHGAYKPAGLRRMYPNVLTREALIEFEYNGWTKQVTPIHDNILPYMRMVTGPMDYIPYTTHNAQKKNFRPVGEIPMGQGTRAHSMAQFVIYESPMQMLPDSPSDYYKERECTEFISNIPLEWDDLKVLHTEIGGHTVLARKNGDDWFIGAITSWDPKSFEISLDFLDAGEYQLEYIEDGINADTRAIDYVKKSKTVSNEEVLNISLVSGGGWVGRLTRMKD